MPINVGLFFFNSFFTGDGYSYALLDPTLLCKYTAILLDEVNRAPVCHTICRLIQGVL